MPHTTYTTEIEGEDVELEIEYEIDPGWPDDGDPGSIDLTSVKLAGEEIGLTPELEAAILAQIEEETQDAEASYGDYLYDLRSEPDA